MELTFEEIIELNKRVMAWSILMDLIHKYDLTKARKLNKFLGIKNGKALLKGDLELFDQDELIKHTGKIIGCAFLYGLLDD